MSEKNRGEILLEARHLTKCFPAPGGEKTACRDVCLSVLRGRTLGIVGESGCGKSTLARMLIHILPPTEGEIFLEGKELTSLTERQMRPLRRKMQMVFQDPVQAFHPRMRVIDIVTEPLMNYGLLGRRDREERAAQLLEMVELGRDYLYRYPHSMSGGQRQRVGIARALALEPEIIICDEATSALDMSVQDKIIALLARLQREKGLSYIFICHDVALVQSFSHEVAVMYQGSVVEKLSGRSMARKAIHPYTKAMTASVFSLTKAPACQMDQKEDAAANEGEDFPGCPYYGRCPLREEICRRERPQLREMGEGHEAACHLCR